VKREGESYRLSIAFPPQLQPLLVHKGSVAVDGVSLTVASIDDGRGQFDVQIIPFTWLHTGLRTRQVGDPVNLECDILGKYVVRALELRGGSAAAAGTS
jgi:riboflavin synthase